MGLSKRYLYTIGLLAAIAVGALALELLFVSTGSSLTIFKKTGWGLPALYVTALVITLVFVRVAAPGGFSSFFKAYADRWTTALGGLLAFFCATSLFVLFGFAALAALGVLKLPERGWSQFNDGLARKLAIGFMLAFLVAFIEELLFRGALMRFLRWNPTRPVTVAAAVVSAAIFALSHNISDPLAWLDADQFPLLVGLCLLGVLLAAAYLASASIGCAIGLHWGLLVLGRVLTGNGVIEIDFSPWWMGGTGDIRTAPVTWAMFVTILIVVWVTRDWLHRTFAVESEFVGMPLAAEGGAGDRLRA